MVGEQAVKMTRLSCRRFRPNEVRVLLSLIAYNVGNLWRRLVSPNIWTEVPSCLVECKRELGVQFE